MVEILRHQLVIHAIKCIIMNKGNGFEGPGAFVFKDGDKALFVGYSSDISTYLRSSEFDQYIHIEKWNDRWGNKIKYTHIEQYLTQNNYLAASLADWLRENLRPTENKEEFIESKWDIIRMYDEYTRSGSEERYLIALSIGLCEEKFENVGRQMNIEEAWGIENKNDVSNKE